jgi:hypothetical protein
LFLKIYESLEIYFSEESQVLLSQF